MHSFCAHVKRILYRLHHASVRARDQVHQVTPNWYKHLWLAQVPWSRIRARIPEFHRGLTLECTDLKFGYGWYNDMLESTDIFKHTEEDQLSRHHKSFLWDTSIFENFIINILCLTTVDKLPMFEENPCENNSRKYHNYSHCKNYSFWWSNSMYLSYSNDFCEEYHVLSFGACIHCGLLVCNLSSHYSHPDIFVGFVNRAIIRLNALKHEVMLDVGTIPLTTTNSHNPLLSYFVTVIPSMAIRDICIWK